MATDFYKAFIGVPFAFPTTNLPEGFTAMDGKAIDKKYWPVLHKMYGDHLPDVRGMFIRYHDGGRGIDPDAGRALLSVQGHLFASHGHDASVQNAGTHSHAVHTNYGENSTINQPYRILGDDGAWNNQTPTDTTSVQPSGDHTHSISVGSSGGSETRPINMDFYCGCLVG
jgi:hypothetical protein